MNLSEKEKALLCDLKAEEQLCVEKYTRYESTAHDTALKNLFAEIKATEAEHLATVIKVMHGDQVEVGACPTAKDSVTKCMASSVSPEEKKQDAYLLKDALMTEKQVSSVYNSAVFEFKNPALRDVLSHMQKEEQDHGERLYSYMAINGMYSSEC